MTVLVKKIQYEQIKFVEQESDITNSCLKPFSGNPGGCPNYGRTWNCPPNTPALHDVKNMIRDSEHCFLIIGREKIDKNSETEEQSRLKYSILVHRINHIIKVVRQRWPDILSFHGPSCKYCIDEKVGECTYPSACRFPEVWTYPPEAVGINVFQTMASSGYIIQKSPEDVVYRAGLICLATHHNKCQFIKLVSRLRAHTCL